MSGRRATSDTSGTECTYEEGAQPEAKSAQTNTVECRKRAELLL